jgi:hypothetical protein
LQRGLVEFGYVAQQRIAKLASKHRADLRDLARRPKPIQPRREGLLQGQWDGLNAAKLATRRFVLSASRSVSRSLDAWPHVTGAVGLGGRFDARSTLSYRSSRKGSEA